MDQCYVEIGVLEQLMYLCKIFLKDICCLQQKYPDHPLWQHKVFFNMRSMLNSNKKYWECLQRKKNCKHTYGPVMIKLIIYTGHMKIFEST